MLSLVITTRYRVESLKRLLSSIEKRKSSDVEVIIGFDHDDHETKNFINSYNGPMPLLHHVSTIKPEHFCVRCNSYHVNRHKELLNPMSKLVSGDYIWGLNDDTEMMTDGFDLLLKRSVEEFLNGKSNRLFYGKTHEIFRLKERGLRQISDFQSNFACYPVLTKETVDIFGGFIPEEIPGSNADIVLSNIFHKSNTNRFHLIKDVVLFDHIETSSVKPNPVIKPFCKYTYSNEHFQRDVEKLNSSISGVEYTELDYVYIKYAFKCKSCFANMYIGCNSNSNSITCPECSTINYVDPNLFNHFNQFKNLERNIVGDLKGR